MRIAVSFLVLASAAVVAIACSSGGEGQAGPGPSAEAEDGGDAARSADGSPIIPTPVSACRTYIQAYCDRYLECTNTPWEQCNDTLLLCPSYFFATGSARDPLELTACAAERRVQSCDELLAGRSPTCAVTKPGTKKGGEPCSFSSACESLTCYEVAGCKVCAQPLADGDKCPVPNGKCPINSTCNDGTCKPIALPAVFPENAACTASDTTKCGGGRLCIAPVLHAAGTCIAPPREGDPCGYTVAKDEKDEVAICQAGLRCDGTTSRCVKPCHCDAPLVCNTSERCVEAVGVDADCTGRTCGAGLFCYTPYNPGGGSGEAYRSRCRPLPGLGEEFCRLNGCAAGLFCDEPRNRCAVRVGDGEPCDANRLCSAPLECQAGVCTAVACRSDAGSP